MKSPHLTDAETAAASMDVLREAYRALLLENQALRALISERTCAAVEDLRARGLKYNGNLPYGVEAADKTKKLRPSRYETRLITEIQKMHSAGQSLRAIARTLAERNFVNRKGNPIDAKQVSRILAAVKPSENAKPSLEEDGS